MRSMEVEPRGYEYTPLIRVPFSTVTGSTSALYSASGTTSTSWPTADQLRVIAVASPPAEPCSLVAPADQTFSLRSLKLNRDSTMRSNRHRPDPRFRPRLRASVSDDARGASCTSAAVSELNDPVLHVFEGSMKPFPCYGSVHH